MIKVTDLPEAQAIADPEMRQLALRRIAELSEQGFSLPEVGEIWIVQGTDALADIEKRLGAPVNAYELIENRPSCIAATYVLDQAGRGIEMFIPKSVDLAEQLAMCLKGSS